MIKILHIIPSLNKGGAERLVLDICNELAQRNDVLVQLITFRPDNAYSFLTKNIKWKIISSVVIPSITKQNMINVKKLQKEIDDFQPNVIHSHLFETEIILSQIHFSKAKYFVHFHDNMPQMENFRLACLYNKLALTQYFEKLLVLKSYGSRLTTFIAISNDTFSYTKRVLPNRFKKIQLLNAINISRFSSPKEVNTENRITIIGSLVEKKGQKLAIETIAELKNRNIYVLLDIIGEGILRQDLKTLIEQLGLQKQITLHGNNDYPEEFLKLSKIYLHTAIYEPFGLVIIEAMASGLPVICTDGIGNRPLIIDKKNGFMVWERNPILLADKIEMLLKNEELRFQIGKNARNFAQNYGIEAYVDKLLNSYRNS